MHLITSHVNTDFDSLASMIAVQKLYPEAVICPPGAMNRRVRDFVNRYGHHWKLLKPSKIPIDQVTMMVVTDTRARSRLGPFAALAGKHDVEVHVYDHHPPTIDDIPATKMVYEPIGSATTLLVERLVKERARITPEEATLFALGIYDDTGALTYEATTDRDIVAIARLRQMDADMSMILPRAEVSMPTNEHKLLDDMVENSWERYINGAKVVFSWAESEEYIEGLAIFVHKLRDYCDSLVTIAAVRCGKKTCLIARSAPNILNVKDLLSPYGGSGHLQAGSATLHERDPLELLRELEDKLPDAIAPVVKVGEVMTYPVMAIAPDTDVGSAYRTMLRFGYKAMPVADGSGGGILGIMTRSDLDKAYLHGFEYSPVQDFMTEGVITLPVDASVLEAHRMMAVYGFERIPVVQEGRLAGIITRSDLVRALYQTSRTRGEREPREDAFLCVENISAMMEAAFSPEVIALLRRIGEKALALGMKAYIVGGAVRDILLGERNVDLDISIEGDAETFVKSWSEPGCRTTVHGRYKTGTLAFSNGLKVDVVTARREFYEYAAAMPEISSDSLKQDLARRDFTVNAMAASVNHRDWGILIDFYGGYRDLGDKVLRVLHNLSFVEDPTRILRGVRLEQRLGLKFEDNTLRLISSAVRGGLLGKLSDPRVRTEIELNCRDMLPHKIAARMQELQVWDALFPGLRISAAALKKMRYLQKLFSRTSKAKLSFKDMEWLTYLAAVFSESAPNVRVAGMDRMNLSPQERDVFTACLASLTPIEQFFGSNKNAKNSEAFLFLKTHSQIALLYCMVATKRTQVRRWIARHLFDFSFIKSEVTGKELLDMGYSSGPWIGEMLEGVRLERMDGKIKSRADELWYLKENLMRY